MDKPPHCADYKADMNMTTSRKGAKSETIKKNPKWDRDRIRAVLVRCHKRGEEISYNAMCLRNQALVSASAYHFGSYRKAIAMAGLEYANIRQKPKWTKKKVVDIVRRANQAGEDLSWRVISHRRDELGHAAMAAVHPQLFGQWNKALEASGISPRRVSRYRHWTEVTIVKEIQRRHAKKRPVGAGVIQVEIPGLYGAAKRLFGSYPKALQSAGIDPLTVVRRRHWTKKTVIAGLRDFAQQHGTLSHTRLRDTDSGLLRAAYQFFGGIDKARKSVGATVTLNGHARKAKG